MTKRFFRPGFITGVGVGFALKETDELFDYFGFVSGRSHLVEKGVLLALMVGFYGSLGLGLDYAVYKVRSYYKKEDEAPAQVLQV